MSILAAVRPELERNASAIYQELSKLTKKDLFSVDVVVLETNPNVREHIPQFSTWRFTPRQAVWRLVKGSASFIIEKVFEGYLQTDHGRMWAILPGMMLSMFAERDLVDPDKDYYINYVGMELYIEKHAATSYEITHMFEAALHHLQRLGLHKTCEIIREVVKQLTRIGTPALPEIKERVVVRA